MQEVQFISDLAINMIEGLRDFNASYIDRYYRDYDSDFPRADEMAERMEFVFSRLTSLNPNIIKDSVFKQYQLCFSLMIAIDRFRAESPSAGKIESIIKNIDSQVNAFQELVVKTEGQTQFLEGFTGGNLHRIKTRLIRDQVISAAF